MFQRIYQILPNYGVFLADYLSSLQIHQLLLFFYDSVVLPLVMELPLHELLLVVAPHPPSDAVPL